MLGGNAAAIVFNAQPLYPAGFECHIDARCARVETVFQQFFECRSGPFHYLARGDLADDQIRQQLDKSAHAEFYIDACWGSGQAGVKPSALC